jgi:hypothetical protein
MPTVSRHFKPMLTTSPTFGNSSLLDAIALPLRSRRRDTRMIHAASHFILGLRRVLASWSRNVPTKLSSTTRATKSKHMRVRQDGGGHAFADLTGTIKVAIGEEYDDIPTDAKRPFSSGKGPHQPWGNEQGIDAGEMRLAAAVVTDHFRRDRGLVNEHQARRLKRRLLGFQRDARSRNIRTMLLAACIVFFERDLVTIVEAPDRARSNFELLRAAEPALSPSSTIETTRSRRSFEYPFAIAHPRRCRRRNRI